MWNRLRFQLCFHKSSVQVLNDCFQRNLHTNKLPFKEVQIPVKWGHVAGKLWGSEHDRPILALHGWQDNAGTWDVVAPLLSQNRSILAIDFPGHGLSSWIPPGLNYNPWDFPELILYLKDYFKWDKVSLLGHSMGAIAAFRFAALFPEDVDFYIAVDNLVSDTDLVYVIEECSSLLQKRQIAQTRLNEEPPSYSSEVISKIWYLGSKKSVASENLDYLLSRGAKQSKVDPTKYYFTRDPRLKYMLFLPEDKRFVATVINNLICPTLFIKAKDSKHSLSAHAIEMRKAIEKSNDKFECHFVPGTHHVHLNNPEIVLPIITPFLKKYS